MSDYLWDKTGEPDAEVERLEGLLGALRFEPRALELPDEALSGEAATRAHANVVRSAGFFARLRAGGVAGLAAAAAVLLAVLAGTLVMLRAPSREGGLARQSRTEKTEEAAKTEGVKPDAASNSQVSVSKPVGVATHGQVAKRDDEGARALKKSPAVAPRNQLVSDASARALLNARTNRLETAAASSTSARGVVSNGAADLESRMRAKEQLVYAMRLTSEALREVRGKASGEGARVESFDGRSRFRRACGAGRLAARAFSGD